MLDSMELCAPWPIETIAITEAMPIIIPKIVKLDRTLLPESAKKLSWNKSEINIDLLFYAIYSLMIIFPIAHDFSISDHYNSVSMFGDVLLVGNQYYRLALRT